MRGASAPTGSVWLVVLNGLVVIDVIALLFAGIVHLIGANIELGSLHFVEPPIIPASVVETAAGVIFIWAAYKLFRAGAQQWIATLVAHVFAVAGFILGLVATSGGTTPFNYTYHRVMLVIFAVGLILLFVPSVRAALGREDATR